MKTMVKRENNTVFMKLVLICYLSLVAMTQSGDSTSGSGMTDSDLDRTTEATAREYIIGNLQIEKQDGGTPSPDTGLYLMSQEAHLSGQLKALRACGFRLISSSSHPPGTETSLTFFVAGYQLVGNSYERHTDPFTFFLTINATDSFGCGELNIPGGGLPVSKGDKAGVLVQQAYYCNQFAINSPIHTCPAHINMVDPVKNCSQALYFNNTRDDENMPERISIFDGNPVNIFINMDITIEADALLDDELPSPTCAVKVHGIVYNPVALIAVMTAIGVVLLVMAAITAYFCCKKVQEINVTKKSNLQSWSHRHDHEHQQPAANILTKNGYFVEQQAAILQVSEDHYEKDSNFLEEQQLKGGDYDYANLEQFWEPADQESALKEQLFCLNIKEIPIEELEIKQQLGCGQFATVHHGIWKNREDHNSFRDVAVKCLKGEASEEERIKFLQEAAIMGQFEHPNILQMLALSYDEDLKPILIVDLMHIGDLHHHLHSLRPKEGQEASHKLGPTLLSYSRQVAFGMHYLSCKKFIHRDLAARNVLVAKDGICKIADFGLSRDLQNKDYYVSHGGKVPVKWTAPEALHYHKYSTASDVWSYGCLLYEIWSLGHKPFSMLTNVEVLKQVVSGYRLPPPPGCPKAIYSIMIQCWNPNPDVRMSFLKIVVALQHPDYKILSWSPEDIDTQSISEKAKCLGAPLADSESLYRTLQHTYISNVDSVS